jgi:hypothetical protein
MGRFEPTGPVDVRELEHSVLTLPWGALRGALGPSDGTAGAAANVPSALSVLRHVQLYLEFPAEIDEAFAVLEQHAIRHGRLYPVALATLPFLFDIVRRGSPVAERITDLIAEYASAAATLEAPHRDRLQALIVSRAGEIASWLGRYDRAVCALAMRAREIRTDLVVAISSADHVAPIVLLALVELGAAPGRTVELAHEMLATGSDVARMCAAAFLSRYGERTPDLAARIDAALPPSAPAALRTFAGKLWSPTIERPAVAPKIFDAEVVFCGERVVLVKAGERTVTLPWPGAPLERGDHLKVGITAHGQPKLALLTEASGTVTIIDF